MPEPVGHPDCDNAGGEAGWCPVRTGAGETDWTLSTLQMAEMSLTGPSTWPLVGMALARTLLRGCRSRTSPRLSA